MHLTAMHLGLDPSFARLLSIHPVMFFLAVTFLLWLGTLLGGLLRNRRSQAIPEEAATFKTLESAVLALLGLLLGFTFSMGVSRHDLRKNLEVAESNNLLDLWLRTGTLPDPVRTAEQTLIRKYVPIRLDFLNAGTSRTLIERSVTQTAALQNQMWRTIGPYANSHADPVTAGFLAALTSTVSVTESRTAAFENRIPVTAWGMLLFIGFMASVLVGVGMTSRSRLLRFILPVVVASALSLTLDMDSPRSGLIRMDQYSLDRMATRINNGPLP